FQADAPHPGHLTQGVVELLYFRRILAHRLSSWVTVTGASAASPMKNSLVRTSPKATFSPHRDRANGASAGSGTPHRSRMPATFNVAGPEFTTCGWAYMSGPPSRYSSSQACRMACSWSDDSPGLSALIRPTMSSHFPPRIAAKSRHQSPPLFDTSGVRLVNSHK